MVFGIFGCHLQSFNDQLRGWEVWISDPQPTLRIPELVIGGQQSS